jgi:hypothetical protein
MIEWVIGPLNYWEWRVTLARSQVIVVGHKCLWLKRMKVFCWMLCLRA